MKKLKQLLRSAFADTPFPLSHADLVAGAAMAEVTAQLLEAIAQLLEAIAAELEPPAKSFEGAAAFFRSIGVTPPEKERPNDK